MGKGRCLDEGYRKRRIRVERVRDFLLSDHTVTPLHKEKKCWYLSHFFSLFLFFSFFQTLFSFSTWQHSLKLLSFPNRELFPDSLPLSYNYSAGLCFSVLFSGLRFQHCVFCTQGDITSQPQWGEGGQDPTLWFRGRAVVRCGPDVIL